MGRPPIGHANAANRTRKSRPHFAWLTVRLRRLRTRRPSILRLIRTVGTFSFLLPFLIGATTYVVEIPQRAKQSNYTAWQLINSAQGQAASGGRIEALEDLNAQQCLLSLCLHRRVPLGNLNANGAVLDGVNLEGAMLNGGQFKGSLLGSANFMHASLQHAAFGDAFLRMANLSCAQLERADFSRAILIDANLGNAYLANPRANAGPATLEGALLMGADFHGAEMEGVSLQGAFLSSSSFGKADFRGARGLTAEQVKRAENWEAARYDRSFYDVLGLPAPSQQELETAPDRLFTPPGCQD